MKSEVREYSALVISVMSLLLSIFVAWKQFTPPRDDLVIEGELQLSEMTSVLALDENARFFLLGKDKSLGGPFILNLTFSNNLNRAVSIKKVSVANNGELPGSSYTLPYSNLDAEMMSRIVRIDANSVQRVSYSIKLPVYLTENISLCLKDNGGRMSLSEVIINCYYRKNIDIFGNFIRYISLGDAGMIFTEEKAQRPSVTVRVITGDNSAILYNAEFSSMVPRIIKNQ
jgi:hypothetical protein